MQVPGCKGAEARSKRQSKAFVLLIVFGMPGEIEDCKAEVTVCREGRVRCVTMLHSAAWNNARKRGGSTGIKLCGDV